MSNPPTSLFVEKVSGAISGGLSDALERQSPSLAAARKYQERFLSSNRLADNKRVYISAELHAFLNRMVAVVGKEKTSVGNYVTEIVREHLERNRESINAIYLTNTQPLF